MAFTSPAFAQGKLSGSSATLQIYTKQKEHDKRVEKLEAFLRKKNSELAPSAKTLVEAADKNDLDWKLLAAIAGLESTFCHRIPQNSHNCWGWGIYGNNVIRFKSYDEGIVIISQGLREKYMDKWGAKDVYQVGKMYAASPTWAVRVLSYMRQIEEFEPKDKVQTLSISL